MSLITAETSDSSSEWEDAQNEDRENESQSSISDLDDSSEDTTSFGLEVFQIQSFMCANNIKLCSYSHYQGNDLFALVLGSGELLFYKFNFDPVGPLVKWIPWFDDSSKKINAITFQSSSASWLLVASYDCSLHIIPVLSIIQNSEPSQSNVAWSLNDITTLSIQGKNVNCENLTPCCLCWWENTLCDKDIGIIGGSNGEILLVDLSSGQCIGITKVKGEIMSLEIFKDGSSGDCVFLLITNIHRMQWKILLEHEESGYSWPLSSLSSSKMKENSGKMSLGSFPAARAKIQGFKQLSVEKFNNLRIKLTDSKNRTFSSGDSSSSEDSVSRSKFSSLESNISAYNTIPEPLAIDVFYTTQLSQGRHLLTGLQASSSTISIHALGLDIRPTLFHRLHECDIHTKYLLTDLFLYVTQQNGNQLSVFSTNLSQYRKGEDTEFNKNSFIQTFTFQHEEIVRCLLRCPANTEKKVRDTESSQSISSQSTSKSKNKICLEDMGSLNHQETCVIVTNKSVYHLRPRDTPGALVFEYIREQKNLEKSEILAKIFGLDLQMILETVAEKQLEFGNLENAVTLYKLSKCQPLKSVLKLAEAGFTDRLLTYITSLLHQNSQVSNLSLTEKVHLSNLCVMSYTEQLQRSEPDSKSRLEAQFFAFLRQNHSYDENLAVNVAAQSRLCIMLQFLAKYRGLIQEVATVLAKLINYQMQNNTGCPIHFIDGFWDLMSEQCLRESINSTSKVSSVVLHFIDFQRESLNEDILLKLCHLYDPTHPVLKPILKKTLTEPPDDTGEGIPAFRQWITTFLCLVLQLTASHITYTPRLVNYVFTQIPSEPEELSEPLVEIPEVPLSGGFYHVALVRNRRVHTWGSSSYGALGNGPTMSQISEPEPVVWFRNNKIDVSSVACGRLHTLVLTSSGVYAWGSSQYGQLGIGLIDQSPHPRIIPALANIRVVSISAGQYHSLAITSQGKLYTWGWGVHGQLGLNTVEDMSEPQLVKALEHEVIISAKGGHAHSIALTKAGRVWAFGSGIFGQLGTGSNTKHKVPIELYGLPEPISMIATGYFHNLALGTSNRLYTWGSSPQVLRSQSQAQKRARMMCYSNQVKNAALAEFNSEVTSPDANNENKIHLAPSPSSASEKNETAEYASFMQSFLSSADDGMAHMSPTLVDTSHVKAPILQICCGCHHSMLLSREGRVYTWGRNVDGQLGNGSRKEVHTPTAISINIVMTSSEVSSDERSPLLSSSIKHITCGGDFSLAMDESGKVWAWGTNVQGQLGKLPVEDLTSKATLEGRLVTFKTSKRVIRLPHGTINMADIPREIPTLPTIRFSYSTMDLCNGHFSDPIVLKLPTSSSVPPDSKPLVQHSLKRLTSLDSSNTFQPLSLHYALEVFFNFYETSIVKSCASKLNNYQAVAKIEMLEKHYDIALKNQLYALLKHSNQDLQTDKLQVSPESNSSVQCRRKMCEILHDTVNNNLKCSPIEPEIDVRIEIHQSDVSSSVDVDNSAQIQSSCDSISDIHMFSLQGGAEELSITSQDGGSDESDDLLDSPDTMTSVSINEDQTKPQSLTPSADTKPLNKDHLDNTSSNDLLSTTEDLNMNGTDENVTTEEDLNNEHEVSLSESISELESTSYTTNNKHSSEHILTVLKQDISGACQSHVCSGVQGSEEENKHLINAVVEIFEFYISLLNSSSDSNTLMLLLHEGLSFWLSQELPVAKLEELLLKHWDTFSYPLSLLLLSEYELKDKKDLLSGSEMLGKFSTKFNCKLCNSLVEKLSDKDKNYSEFIDMLANITPGSHLYPQAKNSKETLDNTLDLLEATTSPNQFISLQFPQVDSTSSLDEPGLTSATDKMVAFTCGHHYATEQSYLSDIDKFATALEDRGKINTAQMYKQIYQQEPGTGWSGTIQAACPKCIHNLIAQTSRGPM
ncbi:hypothetical protein M8J77_003717 [Diaphorina citri]|nr:hypothetical protein M8J77_003717 [Diaphorina citri]